MSRPASTVPATMPMSPTPSAIRPTISSLSRSSRSTLTCGWAARNELKRLGQEFGQRVGVGQHPHLAGEPARHRRRGPRAAARPAPAWCGRAAAASGRPGSASRPAAPAPAAARRAPPPCCGCGCEAAASARCARPAPWVMLPASTTWRNRLRSVRSKRMALFPFAFVFGEGRLSRKCYILKRFILAYLSQIAKQCREPSRPDLSAWRYRRIAVRPRRCGTRDLRIRTIPKRTE